MEVLQQPAPAQSPAPATTIPQPARILGVETFFLPYQAAWIRDRSRLRIVEKSRQVGLSYADAYDSVRKAAIRKGRDVWVMSRDELQARQYIRYCRRWANVLEYASEVYGERLLKADGGKRVTAQVLSLASGASIYALSSNPDAIVGKSGHVKLDEFALHKDQRTLYAVAKPVIQWGGTLSIISTHRGIGTVFNQLVVEIRDGGNPMGWSLHSVPIQRAIEQGLVERINAATGSNYSRERWKARQRAECIDEEQWQQEYCCAPADESAAFITYEMIAACEMPALELMSLKDLLDSNVKQRSFYIGVDVARKTDLCVLDLGEKIGDVVWDRVRIELAGKSFGQIEGELYAMLSLPQVKRACIDATG